MWLGFPRPASVSHLYGGGSHFSSFRDQTPFESCGPSRCGSDLSPRFGCRGRESPHYNPWTCDLNPGQEEISMEEEEEGEEEEEKEEKESAQEQLSNLGVSQASSNVFLLSNSGDISEGLTNPAFCQDDSQPNPRTRPSTQFGRPLKYTRWVCLSRDHPYGHFRSLSSSVENMTFSRASLSPSRGTFHYPDEPLNKHSAKKSFSDETLLQFSRSRGTMHPIYYKFMTTFFYRSWFDFWSVLSVSAEWSKSSDFTQVLDKRRGNQNRKTVKIQESSPERVRHWSHQLILHKTITVASPWTSLYLILFYFKTKF